MLGDSHKRPHIAGIHVYGMSRLAKSIETESKLEVTYGWGWGTGTGVAANEGGASFGGDDNVWNLMVAMVAQFCECNKTHCITCFKGISFM